MAETKDSLTDVINASGFLFQLKLEEEIKKSRPVSRIGEWQLIAKEHKRLDPLDGKEGFIDLVLEAGICRIVIECKRVTDASWLFLIPSEEIETKRGQFLWTESKANISDWHNFNVNPPSLESTFCVVRGQGEKDTPLLERLASLLLRSTEGLANEELKITFKQDRKIRLYLPIIVTNAMLFACRFNISDINLDTGKLSESDFKEVPFIRFRKNLSSTIKSDSPFTSNLSEINQQNERTVLIINAKELTTTLTTLDIPYHANVPWPWE
jgi:hypothetical protein